MAQFEKSRHHDSVMLSLRSILRVADRQWRQWYRCAPDPSQAQDDVGSEAWLKLTHYRFADAKFTYNARPALAPDAHAH